MIFSVKFEINSYYIISEMLLSDVVRQYVPQSKWLLNVHYRT